MKPTLRKAWAAARAEHSRIYYTHGRMILCESCQCETDEFADAQCWENVSDNLKCTVCGTRISKGGD